MSDLITVFAVMAISAEIKTLTRGHVTTLCYTDAEHTSNLTTDSIQSH